MQLDITREFLEHCVPAFETSNDDIFNRLLSFFDAASMELETVIGPKADQFLAEWEGLTDLAKKYVCTRAARLAIPQLDLVLTQTGFGITSTSNIAPASRDRVLSLQEHLRHTESLTYDILLSQLSLMTSWKETIFCRNVVRSLLWSASSMRANGVTIDGQPVYQEEYLQLRDKLNLAENRLTEIISDELYKKLVESQLKMDKLPEHYIYVRDLCIRFLVSGITGCGLPMEADKLMTYLDKYADEFTEYKNSDIYAANHVKRYQNTKNSKCHFW